MSTTLATNGSITATKVGVGRRLDRMSDGTLWALYGDSAGASSYLYYSKDGGTTWTLGQTLSGMSEGAIFVDLDDFVHIAWLANGTTGFAGAQLNGYAYYTRGTPNAGKTAITWGTPQNWCGSFSGSASAMDVVAYRKPGSSPTTWEAHVVGSQSGFCVGAHYTIANAGTLTDVTGSDTGFLGGNSNSTSNAWAHNAGLGSSNSSGFMPSIDFLHTGDGKTVAGGTPHVFLVYNTGTGGTANGARFRKGTWSAGVVAWGTEAVLDSTRKSIYSRSWIGSFFDGTRVCCVGGDWGTNEDTILYERDVADTTTTTTNLALAPGNTATLGSGCASYDSLGNIYIAGNDGLAAGSSNIGWRKWTRSGATLSARTNFDTTGPVAPYVVLRRGYGGAQIDALYTDYAASSPYAVTYTKIAALNQPPNASTGLSPTGSVTIDRSLTQRFSWTFSDPDAGDTQSKVDIQYRIGTGGWTTVTDTTTNWYHDFAGATFSAATYEWQVRTYDSTGTVGPWSSSSFFVAANAPATPSITAPTSGSTVAANSTVATWSAPSQDAYELRTVGDIAGSPDTGTIYTDSGVVVDSSGRSRTVTFAVNGRTEHIQVRVQVAGLWSTWADARVVISFTVPATPTLVATVDSPNGRVVIVVTDPTPTGGQPTVIGHDIYRRIVGTVGSKRYAASVGTTWVDYGPGSRTAYEYQVVAIGSTGATAPSVWTA